MKYVANNTAVAMCLAILAAWPASAAELQKQTVYTSASAMIEVAIAADEDGNPHVVFHDRSTFDLIYACNIGGSWTLETVDNTGSVGGSCDITVDGLDRIHILYESVTPSGRLKYATKLVGGGSWTSETVSVGAVADIAIVHDVFGEPHGAFIKSGALTYVAKSGIVWSEETIPYACPDVPDITTDSSGDAHISFSDYCTLDLKYTTNAGGSWSTSTLDSTGVVGTASSIHWHPTNGDLYLSYQDVTNGFLKFAQKSGSSWTITNVPGVTAMWWHKSAIDVDGSNRARIAYRQDGADLAVDTGAGWETSTVELAAAYPDMDLDPLGGMHIVYYESFAVHYATPGPVCAVEPVSVAFDTVFVGATQDTTVTFRNAGSETLNLNVSLACAEYSIIGGGGAHALGEGDSVEVIVRFEPTTAGEHMCTLDPGDTLCTVDLTGVAIIDDPDGDGIPTVLDNCPDDYNPGQEDTDTIAGVEEFEGATFDGDWSHTYATNGAQSGGVCPGDWAATIDPNGLSGAQCARLWARSDVSCAPWGVFAAIDRTFPAAERIKCILKFDDIQGSGGSGGTYFDIIATNAQNTSQSVVYRYSTTADFGGDFQIAVNPGDEIAVDHDLATHFFNKFGSSLPGDVIVRFRSLADYAELSGQVRTCDVRVDAIEITGAIGDGVGDACDNCPTLFNPAQADTNGNGTGDECEGSGPVAVGDDRVMPAVAALHQNYPNPFNPTTVIRFDVPAGGARVQLAIFDVRGRRVAALVDGRFLAGAYRETWNGTNAAGQHVATGVYFYRLLVDDQLFTRRMLLLK